MLLSQYLLQSPRQFTQVSSVPIGGRTWWRYPPQSAAVTLIKGALPQTRVQQTSRIYEYTQLMLGRFSLV
jgi:hypothetical protein